jgi:hypothetical protein
MPKIYVEINQAIDFNINIYNTPIGEKFFNQHATIRKVDPDRSVPIITDFTKYTINYFITRSTISWPTFFPAAAP